MTVVTFQATRVRVIRSQASGCNMITCAFQKGISVHTSVAQLAKNVIVMSEGRGGEITFLQIIKWLLQMVNTN